MRTLRMRRATLAILACLMLAACSWMPPVKLKEPTVSLVSFSRLPGDNVLEQRFALRLRLGNPNNLRLKVAGLSFDFAIEGYRLITGVSREVPVIEPYGEVEFTVQGSAHMLDAIRLFNELRRDPRTRFHYELDTQLDLADRLLSHYSLKKTGEVNLQ